MRPAIAPTRLDAFEAELTAGGIVTRVLERWAGGAVHAERVDARVAASAETRTRLGSDTPGFRRVRLKCGDIMLSEADNWFVPDQLTREMRDTLATTDTPFGIVIAPLAPRRETLAVERLGGDPVLLIRALVLSGAGTPLALVEERYRRAALA